MTDQDQGPGLFLSPYRVLDLTDDRGLLCGKILADLGADVVQVEPPGGSPARNIGPFYHNDPHPEKSLYWWAYAANKRGITLDPETNDGRALLKRLVATADFLVESYAPGYMDSLSIGYEELSRINPGLVMVSISPFGKDGPYGGWKGPDIVGMALGGFMYLTGDSDRPPVRVSFPHLYLHGGAAGATGAMMAHTHRALSGQGQHVDVSCQQAVAKTLAHAPQSWDLEGVILKRMGVFRQTSGDNVVRTSWAFKDGFINYTPQGGSAGVAASTRTLLAWMGEEGLGDDYLDSMDWENMGYGQVRAEVMARVVEPLQRFFLTKTRDELVQASIERRILLFPVATQKDILNHPHLEARDYFRRVTHPELNAEVTYPGMFVKDREGSRLGLRRRPPLIGEHNLEIYQGELGLTADELATLKEGGAI